MRPLRRGGVEAFESIETLRALRIEGIEALRALTALRHGRMEAWRRGGIAGIETLIEAWRY
jgi:hypothetical protein